MHAPCQKRCVPRHTGAKRGREEGRGRETGRESGLAPVLFIFSRRALCDGVSCVGSFDSAFLVSAPWCVRIVLHHVICLVSCLVQERLQPKSGTAIRHAFEIDIEQIGVCTFMTCGACEAVHAARVHEIDVEQAAVGMYVYSKDSWRARSYEFCMCASDA